jgi:hypothetical protein
MGDLRTLLHISSMTNDYWICLIRCKIYFSLFVTLPFIEGVRIVFFIIWLWFKYIVEKEKQMHQSTSEENHVWWDFFFFSKKTHTHTHHDRNLSLRCNSCHLRFLFIRCRCDRNLMKSISYSISSGNYEV